MSAYSDQVVGDGAVAYWRLGETSGTTAVDMIGGNNGTISGGVTLNQPGATTDGNPAMRFDGTSGKVLAPTGAYETIGTGPVTVEFWLRLIGSGGQRGLVDAKNTHFGGYRGFGFWYDVATVYFQVDDSTGQGGTTNVSLVAAAVADGQWRHVVAVLTRGAPDTVSMYINGVLGNSANASANGLNYSSTLGLSIGSTLAAAEYCNGLIDDVAIYKTALTPTQIAAHYATGVSTLTSPFVFLEDEDMLKYNLWTAVTPSDSADLPRVTDGIWVGTGGNLVAVMQNNTTMTFAVPSGGWLPIVARRINATNTTATGIVALNAV